MKIARIRRRLGLAGALTAMVLASLASVAAPAFADTTVDQTLWSQCQSGSVGSFSFDKSSVNWLDQATMTYGATLSSSCFSNTSLSITENTIQPNDRPQIFPLGTNAVGPISGTKSVVPLRTLSWSLRLTSLSFGYKDLAIADMTVVQPQGPLPGGQTNLRVTANDTNQRRLFVQAIETPKAVVTVAGDVDLDLSGLEGVTVGPGAQLIGEQTINPLGPRLFTTTFPHNLLVIPPSTAGSHERISGVRLDGGGFSDPFGNMGDEDANAIEVLKPNVEIDHNEIYSWRGAGVIVNDNDEQNHIDLSTAGTVRVHDNYIHHDQHPTGEICCGHGGGYGVSVVHGAYALVEQNVFDYDRHAMMGGGQPGTGYFFYRNLILPHGGVNSYFSQTHQIDMHGFGGDCLAHECGKGGEYMDVEYNTVWYTDEHGVKLRGTPDVRMDIAHNVFSHPSLWDESLFASAPALAQTETGILAWDNQVGAPVSDTRTTCDFDGDRQSDAFVATGVTWWYQSSKLNGRWVYLSQSPVHVGDITLGDVSGDGLCDVITGGVVYGGGTTPMRTDVLWTRTDGTSSIWHMTGTSIGSQLSPGVLIGVLGTGDFDGDGRSDELQRDAAGFVTVGHLLDGQLWNGNGSQPAGRAANADGTLWTFAGIGDFDGDDHADILWLNNRQLTIWFAGSPVRSALVPATSAGLDSRWQIKGIDDFNGDGNADILFRSSTTGAVSSWFMNGANLISATPSNTPDPSGALTDSTNIWQVAGVGDFDSDGKADILWRKDDGSLLVWLKGAAAGSAAVSASPEASWRVIGVGDFNADGRDDIVWQHSQVATASGAAGQVVIWTMNGAQILQTPTLAAVDGSWTLAGLLATKGVKPVPLAVSPGNQTTVAGTPVSLTLSASGGTPPDTWSVSGLPSGLSANTAGQISGTPAATAAPTSTVTATITDANGQSNTVTFTWNIVIVVPSVVGQTQTTATQTLQAAGLAVSVHSTAVFDSSDGGRVISQSPAAGTAVARGTTISLGVGLWQGVNR